MGTKFVPLTVRVTLSNEQAGVVLEDVVEADSDVMVGSTTGNETELEVLALDAGEATATCPVCTALISAAGSVAVSCAAADCVGGTYVVLSAVVALPAVHCTAEHGSRLAPRTTSVTSAVPAVAVDGVMEVMVGAADAVAATLNGDRLERTPELDTSTFTVATEARNGTGTMAVSCVELTNVVISAEGSAGAGFTAHSTIEPFTKFVPVTVSVAAEGLHDGVVLGELPEDEATDVMVGATIIKGSPLVGPPPGVRVTTAT